jgi:CRISPR-associated endonuclease/helicase Cas3
MEIWGKSKEQDKVTTLDEHINDVLNVFDSLQHNLKSERIKELIKIVIKFHDLGKILPYFQIKSLKNKSYSPFDVYADIPHSLLSALLVNIESLKQEISSILIKEEDTDTYLHFILSAIAYHHWRESFYDIIEGNTYTFESLAELFSNENKRKAIEENLKSISEKIGLSDKSVSINNLWLNGLINGIKYADYITPPYQLYRMPKRIETENNKLKDWVLISGFTMLSDHYASFLEKEFSKNKKDSEIKNADIKPFDFKRIKENISLRLKEILKDKFEENNIWQFNSVQKYFGKNTILLAPTGMGKTEFAFLWTAGKKFFYTLPLRAAVNQIYKRTETICGEDKSGILHSDADVFIYGDGGESESMKIYDFSRQLSMAANVSTGDQFFPYALRPPGYEKIFAKFSYSNLIIDEVQAYDPKAAAIVVKFIEHIVQMGGKFLLMTATLPTFIKEEITNRIGSFQTLDLFQENKKLQTFSKHKLNILTDDYPDGKLSYSEHIIKQIVETAKSNNGQRVLVVLNTIKQAQKVYSDILDAVKTENVSIKLFHSRYSYKHRQKIENDLQNFIGNNNGSRNTKKPKILVATQVVEASLDLDADYLFTELAPWDSLIQRMGRVFRELRPDTQNSNKLIKKRYKEDNIPDNIFIEVFK